MTKKTKTQPAPKMPEKHTKPKRSTLALDAKIRFILKHGQSHQVDGLKAAVDALYFWVRQMMEPVESKIGGAQ